MLTYILQEIVPAEQEEWDTGRQVVETGDTTDFK